MEYYDEHVENAKNLDIITPMYNLREYSDNYEDSSGSLYQFKRDEQNFNTGGNIADVTTNDSPSFKYKSSLLGNAGADGTLNAKIVVPLKYLSNFSRSLEMPLINCKINLELNWIQNCVMLNIAGATIFQITDTKLYVPIVTLSTKDNVNLTKQLNKGFKRSVHWNEYESKIVPKNVDNVNVTGFPLDASFQGVNRLFVLALDNTNGNNNSRVERNSHRKYFLPRVSITKYNVLIDGRNFYDQPISDQIRKYDEVRKVALGRGDDYTTGCLLYYKKLSINCD